MATTVQDMRQWLATFHGDSLVSVDGGGMDLSALADSGSLAIMVVETNYGEPSESYFEVRTAGADAALEAAAIRERIAAKGLENDVFTIEDHELGRWEGEGGAAA